jgi:hypothetical protein
MFGASSKMTGDRYLSRLSISIVSQFLSLYDFLIILFAVLSQFLIKIVTHHLDMM